MLNSNQIVIFSEYMSYLIDAGVQIPTALLQCSKQVPGKGQEQILAAHKLITDESMPLYEALDRVNAFPTAAISAIKAGESTGRLVTVFEEIAMFYSRFSAITSEAIVKLLPILGYLLFGCAIFFGFIMFLFPTMLPPDAMSAPDPDIIVKFVIFGQMIKDNSTAVLIGLALLIGMGIYVFTDDERKGKAVGLLIGVPGIGRGLYELYMAMWSKFFSILQNSGVPYRQTLALTKEMVPSSMYQEFELLDRMDATNSAELIQNDTNIPLSWPVEFTGALQMGLPTGRAPEMLSKAADRLMNTGQKRIQRFVGIANKLGLLFTGLLIGILVIAVMIVNFSQMNMV